MLVFVILLSVPLALAQTIGAEKKTDVSVSVELSSTGQRHDFLVRIRNDEQKSITINSGSLPWVHRYSMIVVAVRGAYLDREVREMFPVADPALLPKTLAAGEAVSGKVSLNERFPDLPSILKTNDVIVFWSYRLYPLEAPPSAWFGGWFVLHGETR